MPEIDAQKANKLRQIVGILLILPWPLLYFGYWSLYHVKGPAADGFGMGRYAAGLFSLCYGLSLYILNRAVVYSRHIRSSQSGSRTIYIAARILFSAGVLGLVPTIFLLFVGFPYSLPGIILIAFALFRWSSLSQDLTNTGSDGA